MTKITLDHALATFTTDTDDLQEASIAYLLNYGLKQSLTDAYAQKRSEAVKAGKNQDTIDTICREAMKAKFAKLLDGTISDRATGPRLRGIDAIVREVALERMQAAAKAKGKELPKSKDLADLLTRYIDRDGEALRAEAQRRMDEMSANNDILDDLI